MEMVAIVGTKTGRLLGVSLPALVPSCCGETASRDDASRPAAVFRCEHDTPWAWGTLGYHRDCMANRTFNIPKSKSTPKRVKIADTIDVAARYFVYKLYEATDGQPKVWGTLRGMGELRATSEGG